MEIIKTSDLFLTSSLTINLLEIQRIVGAQEKAISNTLEKKYISVLFPKDVKISKTVSKLKPLIIVFRYPSILGLSINSALKPSHNLKHHLDCF